jgi:hypothetical protein
MRSIICPDGGDQADHYTCFEQAIALAEAYGAVTNSELSNQRRRDAHPSSVLGGT